MEGTIGTEWNYKKIYGVHQGEFNNKLPRCNIHYILLFIFLVKTIP